MPTSEVGLDKTLAALGVTRPDEVSPRFAVVPIASEDKVIGAIRVARESAAIKGVVLHIDSPGGSALASDRIYHEVTRLAEVKPVVAKYENSGVRIEDDYLITEQGLERLSTAPREIPEIEALMKKRTRVVP